MVRRTLQGGLGRSFGKVIDGDPGRYFRVGLLGVLGSVLLGSDADLMEGLRAFLPFHLSLQEPAPRKCLLTQGALN